MDALTDKAIKSTVDKVIFCLIILFGFVFYVGLGLAFQHNGILNTILPMLSIILYFLGLVSILRALYLFVVSVVRLKNIVPIIPIVNCLLSIAGFVSVLYGC